MDNTFGLVFSMENKYMKVITLHRNLQKFKFRWGLGENVGLQPPIIPRRGVTSGWVRGYSSPFWKMKTYFFGDFWHIVYPCNHILVLLLEESVPCQKIPGTTPDPQYHHPCIESVLIDISIGGIM